jgi:hypothetical protein
LHTLSEFNQPDWLKHLNATKTTTGQLNCERVNLIMIRLETLFPELASKLRRASSAKQRAASFAAAEFAITRARIEHPLVENSLEKARTACIFTSKEKADLDNLAAQLDAKYFALEEASLEGQACTEDYMPIFVQARAVAALSFAGCEDAFQAATEAIYEAATTTDDKEELAAIIQSALQ